MREIVLDTETTGLSWEEGHRIIEIGCVELVGHLPTGRVFHHYLNPERSIPTGAFAVHGISAEALADKPRFREIAEDLLAFLGDAPLVIHNAEFDMAFLNGELALAGRRLLPSGRAICTLTMARQKFPGGQHSLDALCRRFGVDNSGRAMHGALLDAGLLAEVYLELRGGRQAAFALGLPEQETRAVETGRPQPRPRPLPARLTETERAAHAAFVTGLGAEAVWNWSG
jgi:DNA polymerase-3 subunit epsilon